MNKPTFSAEEAVAYLQHCHFKLDVIDLLLVVSSEYYLYTREMHQEIVTAVNVRMNSIYLENQLRFHRPSSFYSDGRY